MIRTQMGKAQKERDTTRDILPMLREGRYSEVFGRYTRGMLRRGLLIVVKDEGIQRDLFKKTVMHLLRNVPTKRKVCSIDTRSSVNMLFGELPPQQVLQRALLLEGIFKIMATREKRRLDQDKEGIWFVWRAANIIRRIETGEEYTIEMLARKLPIPASDLVDIALETGYQRAAVRILREFEKYKKQAARPFEIPMVWRATKESMTRNKALLSKYNGMSINEVPAHIEPEEDEPEEETSARVRLEKRIAPEKKTGGDTPKGSLLRDIIKETETLTEEGWIKVLSRVPDKHWREIIEMEEKKELEDILAHDNIRYALVKILSGTDSSRRFELIFWLYEQDVAKARTGEDIERWTEHFQRYTRLDDARNRTGRAIEGRTRKNIIKEFWAHMAGTIAIEDIDHFKDVYPKMVQYGAEPHNFRHFTIGLVRDYYLKLERELITAYERDDDSGIRASISNVTGFKELLTQSKVKCNSKAEVMAKNRLRFDTKMMWENYGEDFQPKMENILRTHSAGRCIEYLVLEKDRGSQIRKEWIEVMVRNIKETIGPSDEVEFYEKYREKIRHILTHFDYNGKLIMKELLKIYYPDNSTTEDRFRWPGVYNLLFT